MLPLATGRCGGDVTVDRPGTENRVIEVRVWADVTCPWCWIGDRRLENAFSRRPGLEAHRRWQPFQLEPELPEEGMEWERFLQEKWGGTERALPFLEHVASVGREVGLEFRFDRMKRAPNTRRAHALIMVARDEKGEWEVAERLFRAHFQEGLDVSDPSTLGRIGRDAGLAPRKVDEALNGEAKSVARSQDEARERGVLGVPYFLFDQRRALTGAQPAEVFGDVLDHLPPEGDRRSD